MALIVNIHTATEIASVSICSDGDSIAFRQNEQQKEHASFVHAAIEDLVRSKGIALNDIDAYAVSAGPGSYTGLRVGMAAAKGFCYAFSKPLITENTLKVMAQAALATVAGFEDDIFLCPMIDARRMEVFTAIFDTRLQEIEPTCACIVENTTYAEYQSGNKLVVFGSGSAKFKSLTGSASVRFENIAFSADNLGKLAEVAFQNKNFADVTYSQPFYFKDFYSTTKL